MSHKKRPDPHDVAAQIGKRLRESRRGKTFGMGQPTAKGTQRTSSLREITDATPRFLEMRRAGLVEPNARAFRFGACSVMTGHSDENGWHLSIAHPSRYPTWDEIAEARYRLIPDAAVMALILPPIGEYVNLHANCFHLYEVVTVAAARKIRGTDPEPAA
jgi:hypothetical protein